MSKGKENNPDVRKRSNEDIMWVTIWLVLLVGWVSFLIFLAVITNWSEAKAIVGMVIVCNVPTLICSIGYL